MPSQKPLIVDNGLMQRLQDGDWLSLGNFVNVGVRTTINVSSGTITVTQTNHFLQNQAPSGTQNVDNILGGAQEGHIIMFSGDRVRLRSQGNMRVRGGKYVPNNDKQITFMYNGVRWVEIARA